MSGFDVSSLQVLVQLPQCWPGQVSLAGTWRCRLSLCVVLPGSHIEEGPL
jgi:hypothetical protein